MNKFIEPYNEEWKTEFDNLRKFLLETFNCYEVDIQHVGSTSVTYLYAKPILDIIIYDKAILGNISEKLEKIGYVNKGNQGIEGHYAFRQTTEIVPQTNEHKKWQEHHLYVCYSDSLALKNHLLFRDALLGDKKLAEEYSALKIKLVNEKLMTRRKYNKQKTDFIISVLSTLGLDKNELDEIRNANT